MSKSWLTSLPNEVIEQLLSFLDPVDVARVAQCSRLLRLVLYDPKDQTLWRELYLRLPLDDPRKCLSPQGVRRDDVDWKNLLQRFIRARGVLSSLIRPGETLPTLQTLLELVTWVPPLSSPDDLDNISRNLTWVVTTLRGTSLFEEIELNEDMGEEERQLAAHLNVLLGLTNRDFSPEGRVRSRAFVYDMQKYGEETLWGPFLPKNRGGGANWVHLRAIHHVVSMHIVDLQANGASFEYAFFPMSIRRTQIVLAHGFNPDEEEDWAGVIGDWQISFCFCDHTELLRYNASHRDAEGNLDASIFEEPEFGEVYRTLNVSITKITTQPDENHPKRPIIYFEGEMPDAGSSMRGTIQMTVDDQVRWEFRSGPTDQALPVWYSIGIQMGGLRSPYGVLGCWGTNFHTEDDPVGPFWMRRDSAAPGLPMNHVSLNANPHLQLEFAA